MDWKKWTTGIFSNRKRNKYLSLERYLHSDTQTIGTLKLIDKNGYILKEWHSLELAWKDNKYRVSCIPIGSYKAHAHKSPRFGQSFWIKDVPNRSEILIHKGNYYTDILGCILIGKKLKFINNDEHIDVGDSAVAIDELMHALNDVDVIDIIIKNKN